MIKLVSIEVFIIFVVLAFVLGALIGVTIMCCLFVAKDPDKHNEKEVTTDETIT